MNTEPSIAVSNKRLAGILLAIPALLLIPFIAMKFTNEVNWSLFDFIVAGLMLLGAGLTFEFILRKAKTKQQKVAISAVLFLALLLLWAELAVGIFGSPIAGH